MKYRWLFFEHTMNLADFGIRARITGGLALILLFGAHEHWHIAQKQCVG